MASVVIEWLVPSNLNSNLTYTINVYRATAGEDETYSLIDNVSAGPSNTTTSYTDTNGDTSYFYLVRYVPTGGAEGSNVLARIQPTVRMQRLRDHVYNVLPEVIKVRIDANKTQVVDAVQNALNMVNAYAPVTSYTISNMPNQYEPAVVFGGQMLLYLEQLLQVSIRDFSYGVSGISLNIDRGSKINQAIRNLTEYWNTYVKAVKYVDYPDAIGLGSSAVATPQGRVLANLYNFSV